MPEVIDDKTEHCIPFVLERLKIHRERYESTGEEVPPFFLGLNGVQGAGKTTLVSDVYSMLVSYYHVMYEKSQWSVPVPRAILLFVDRNLQNTLLLRILQGRS